MDWEFRSTSVVILGAGFSVAASNGQMPLMRTFFDKLTPNSFPLLHEYVVAVAGNPKHANVESVLLTLDQIRTSPTGVLRGWADQWKENAGDINRQLSSYTLSRLKPCLEISDDNWAANLLADCGPETVVISMNYDNLAERILANREGQIHGTENGNCPHCKMRRLLENACSCLGKREIINTDWQGALVKPHGSISWKRCLNSGCCSYECLVANVDCRPFEPCSCPACHEMCAPVLVMPTMSKNLSDTPEIGVMWQAARRAIADADSIMLFGFSMPTSDELLMQMIRSSIYANKKLRRIASIDLEPDSVLDRFSRCIPEEISVGMNRYPVVSGRTPDWLS